MASDWIKMRIDLQTHPKIVRILSATKSDKFRAIGGLHAVWSVFDIHSEDGVLHGYTPETMDHIIGWSGFSQAMIDVGWMNFDGLETLTMPEFDEHNGQSAKRRAEDQKRKRNERKHKEICPQTVQNLSEISPEKSGLEKRREERNTYTPEIPADLLRDYHEVRKAKGVGKLTKTAFTAIEREAEKAGITAEEAIRISVENGWAGFKAEWIKSAQGKKPELVL